MWMWGPLCSGWGVGRRASREGVCCVPVFWEKDSAHSCARGVNAKQTCLTHASLSAVMALLSKRSSPSSSRPTSTHTYTLHCASPLSLTSTTIVHRLKAAGSEAQPHGPTQEGVLINIEPCGGCGLQYCVSGQTGPSVFSLVAHTYWHSIAQVYTIQLAVFLFFLLFSLHSDWIETSPVNNHTRTVYLKIALKKKLLPPECCVTPSISDDHYPPFLIFLILLKSGDQYKSEYTINTCAVVCMYNFVHAELVEVFLRLLEMLLIRCHVLFCETIYQVFECLISPPHDVKIAFPVAFEHFSLDM